MGNVRLYGSTSGYTELAPPAVAPDGVLSLPSGTGTLLTAEGGKVLQVVTATHATQTATTSTSFVTTGMTASITPSSTSNKILIIHTGAGGHNNTTDVAFFTLFRGTVAGTNLGTSQGLLRLYSYAGVTNGSMAMTWLDSPATASSVTYTAGMRSGSASVTATAQIGSIPSSLTLMEISA
jgi:hypothetical protein